MLRIPRFEWWATTFFLTAVPSLAFGTSKCPPGTSSGASRGALYLVGLVMVGMVLALSVRFVMRARKLSRGATWALMAAFVLAGLVAGVAVYFRAVLTCFPTG